MEAEEGVLTLSDGVGAYAAEGSGACRDTGQAANDPDTVRI
jgi:hypothetical protein